MRICPRCNVGFDETRQPIFCPNCHRTARTTEQCAESVLQCVDTRKLHREASKKYWETIITGMHQIIMDRKTYMEVGNMLFHTPLQATSDLLDTQPSIEHRQRKTRR